MHREGKEYGVLDQEAPGRGHLAWVQMCKARPGTVMWAFTVERKRTESR